MIVLSKAEKNYAIHLITLDQSKYTRNRQKSGVPVYSPFDTLLPAHSPFTHRHANPPRNVHSKCQQHSSNDCSSDSIKHHTSLKTSIPPYKLALATGPPATRLLLKNIPPRTLINTPDYYLQHKHCHTKDRHGCSNAIPRGPT